MRTTLTPASRTKGLSNYKSINISLIIGPRYWDMEIMHCESLLKSGI